MRPPWSKSVYKWVNWNLVERVKTRPFGTEKSVAKGTKYSLIATCVDNFFRRHLLVDEQNSRPNSRKQVTIFFKHLFEIMTVKAVYVFFFSQEWLAYWAMTFKSIMGKEHKLKIHNQCLVTYSHCQLVDTTDAVWCYKWKGVIFVSTMLATLWLRFTSSFNHGIQLKLVPTKFNHQ